MDLDDLVKMDAEQRAEIEAAFRAGVEWGRRNGCDHFSKLDEDAKHYAMTGEQRNHGGFVTVRG
jgi:hypothetical protein